MIFFPLGMACFDLMNSQRDSVKTWGQFSLAPATPNSEGIRPLSLPP